MSLLDVILYISILLATRLFYTLTIYSINAVKIFKHEDKLITNKQHHKYLELQKKLEINFVLYVFSFWKWTTESAIRKQYRNLLNEV